MELNQFRDVDVVLDKANDNIIQKQFVSAGDKDGRSLTVQLTDNGVIGEIIGAALNLYWHNQASGLTDLSAFYVVDRTTSVFKIDYPQNMLTPGKVIAYIQILHGGKVTHTKPFEITVQKLAGTTRGVLATAEYGALVTTLAKANEFETDIAKKADKTQVDALGSEINVTKMNRGENISVTQIDKNLGLLDETYMTETFRQQMAGTTPIGTVPADKSITRNKLANESVNATILDSRLQKLLQKGLTWELGAVGSTGGLVTSPIRIRTELVLLEKGDRIKLLDKVNYKFGYNIYNLTTQEHMSNHTYQTADAFVEEPAYYRFFMLKNDGSDLTNAIQETGNNLLVYSDESVFNITTEKIAKKAVDITRLSEDIQKDVFGYIGNFELGTVNAQTGNVSGTTVRIRTPFISVAEPTTLIVEDSEYQISISRYDMQNNYIDFVFFTNQSTLLPDYKYKIVMRKIDDSVLTDKIIETSKKLTVLYPNSLPYKINKALTNSQTSDRENIDLNEITLQTGNLTKEYDVFVGDNTFVELEFYAKTTSPVGSTLTFLNQTLTINNKAYKPFKLRLYNVVGGSKTLSFETQDTNELTIKNISVSFKSKLEKNDGKGVRFIGHRGISAYAPENTAPAYALATTFGLWGVECDVYQTSDGVWVLLHDPTIDRTSNGSGDITTLTYSELLNYDFGSWKGNEFKDTPIMTLDEFMLMCKQSDLHAYIELKGNISTTNRQSLVELIKKYGMIKNTTILSSSLPRLGLINTIEPKLRLAYSAPDITQTIIDDLKAFNAPCVFDIGFSYGGITDIESKIRLAHDNNIEVEAWTVNSLDEYKELVEAGIDGITTDLFNLEGCYF